MPEAAAGGAAPYYRSPSGDVVLWQGDCEAVLPTLAGEGIDLVVTSPPYNMGLVPGGNGRGMYRPGASSYAGRFRDGYGEHGDAMPQGEYDAWQRRVLAACWALLPEHGAIFYNHRPRIEHGKLRLPLGLDFGLPLRQIITWDRKVAVSTNLRHYASAYEWVFLFAKPAFRLTDHAASGRGDVWRLGMAYDEPEHPAPFPVALPRLALLTTGARCVLDPFAGSGSTLRAAADLRRRAIGVELSVRWCRRAVERLAQGVLPGWSGAAAGG